MYHVILVNLNTWTKTYFSVLFMHIMKASNSEPNDFKHGAEARKDQDSLVRAYDKNGPSNQCFSAVFHRIATVIFRICLPSHCSRNLCNKYFRINLTPGITTGRVDNVLVMFLFGSTLSSEVRDLVYAVFQREIS